MTEEARNETGEMTESEGGRVERLVNKAVSRRSFLKGVGAGAVGVGLAGARASTALGADASPAASATAAASAETWTEPVLFTPNGTEPLVQTVVANQNGLRFSYDGATPGPSIRMRGDETLYMQLVNDLPADSGTSPVGPSPDAHEAYPGPEGLLLAARAADEQYGDGYGKIPAPLVDDWALGEHLNGVHSAHVTNIHTHGLHVAPGKNEDGTHSDDIFLRVIPADDAAKIAEDPALWQTYQENREEILANAADYEFRLGDVMEGLITADGTVARGLPHPPGTHWYHPHSHGATQNQVASGMAGFLIVVGDVDEAINETLTGDAEAQWDQKTGDWDYRERTILLQRVFNAPTANISGPAAGPDPDDIKRDQGNKIVPLVNGSMDPKVIAMRPGAVERWRVLNGSVDGAGYMRFAVLKGRFATDANFKLVQVGDDGTTTPVSVDDFSPITVGDAADPVEKMRLWQMAWDGITLVGANDDGSWGYQVRDLSIVNDGVEPDFKNANEVYKPENLRLAYHRPNEVAMSDGNRTDILFQAPQLDGASEAVYTLVAMPTQIHGTPEVTSRVLAELVVSGDPVAGASDLDFSDLLADVDVHPYEIPVTDEELLITTEAERAARAIGNGDFYRTRVVRYGGWGSSNWPLLEANEAYLEANPDKEKLSWYAPPAQDTAESFLPVTLTDAEIDARPDGDRLPLPTGELAELVPITNIRRYPDGGELPTLILPAKTRSMSIDGEKFLATSETTPKMLLNTAEEWAVYNQSLDIYSVQEPRNDWTEEQRHEYVRNNPEMLYYQFDYADDPPENAPTSPQPWFPRGADPSFGSHKYSYPMTLAQLTAVNKSRGQSDADLWARPGQLRKWQRGADHPFHIHQNPFWLMRIEVPDENGELVNVLPEPRWADVIYVPRNGGRVIFRSRFPDFEGEFVEHCHILLHEDNGMMQRLSVVGNPVDSDYEPREAVADVSLAEADVNAIYPPPTLADSWKQSLQFADRNNTGTIFPGEGFEVVVPEPPTE